MHKNRCLALVVSVAFAVSGCATSSKNIAASYVSPNQYATYDCQQLAAEAGRIQTRVVQLGGRLDEAANNDAGIMAVGLIIFWPVLFALGGTKAQEADYARLKGEYDAVESAAVAKKCAHAVASTTVATPIAAPALIVATTAPVAPAVVPALYVAPPVTPTVVMAAPAKAVGIGGESKYMFSAEQFAKASGCSQPVATMVVRQSLNETFSIDCEGNETLIVRCEAGGCRAMR
jgi:predicted secreted protein